MSYTYILLVSQLCLNIFFSCGFSCFLMCFTVKPDVSQQCSGQQISVWLEDTLRSWKQSVLVEVCLETEVVCVREQANLLQQRYALI